MSTSCNAIRTRLRATAPSCLSVSRPCPISAACVARLAGVFPPHDVLRMLFACVQQRLLGLQILAVGGGVHRVPVCHKRCLQHHRLRVGGKNWGFHLHNYAAACPHRPRVQVRFARLLLRCNASAACHCTVTCLRPQY